MSRFDVNVVLLRKREYSPRSPFFVVCSGTMIFVLLSCLDVLDVFKLVLGARISVFLLTQWLVDLKCFLLYRKVEDIHLADACKVTTFAQIVPLHSRKLAGSLTEEIYFDFRKQRFIYSHEKGTFYKLPYPTKETFGYYLSSTGYDTNAQIKSAAKKWGRNVFEYSQTTFRELVKDNFLLFQVYCFGLCLVAGRGFVYLGLLGLFTVFAVETNWLMTLRHIIRCIRVDSNVVMAYRNGKWRGVAGTDLVPGDIVSIGRVVRKYAEQSIPADMLVLAGSLIVSESTLTGESSPQSKVSISGRRPDEHLSFKRDKKHVLFGGTRILKHVPDMTFHIKTPNAGCIAIVLRTGFKTNQGKLLRTCLFSREKVTAKSWERGLFSFLLVFSSIIALAYLFKKVLERGTHKLFLSYTLCITYVIPPELPMELSMAVYACFAAVGWRHIFFIKPVDIPFARNLVDICCFKKMETWTAYGDMVFSGVRGLSKDTKTIPTRTLEILASCHSLVFVDNKLVGDPLDKAVIEGIPWNYQCEENAMPETRGSNAMILKTVKRHHLASDLKRMTVVVCIKENLYAFVKGPPEIIQERLNEIPASYVSTYEMYTRRGSIVLALAYKPLLDMTESEDRSLDREVLESGLTFAGFAVFKRTTNVTILSELRKFSHYLKAHEGNPCPMLKILVVHGLATIYVMCVMHLNGVKLGTCQALISRLFSIICIKSMFDAHPLRTLPTQRLKPKIMWLSILGQSTFHMLLLISSIIEAKKHMPNIHMMNPNSEFESNLVNTVSYMVSMMIHVATFAVNYTAHPVYKSISENKRFKVTILSAVVFVMVITSGVLRNFNDSLMLVTLPKGLHGKLLVRGAMMFLGCYTWERFLRWGLPGRIHTIINKSIHGCKLKCD